MLTKPGAVQNPLPQRHIVAELQVVKEETCPEGTKAPRGFAQSTRDERACMVVEISAGANFSLFGSDH